MKMTDTSVVLSVIIPVYNNCYTLEVLCYQIIENLGKKNISYEIIFINDGSSDLSSEILRTLASGNSKIRVVNLSRNFGQHPAICAGFERARGDYIVLMDADMQDNPQNIIDLYEKITSSDFDIVFTNRVPSGVRSRKRLTSFFYHWVFSKLTNTKVPINVGTFRIFNKRVLGALLSFEESEIIYGPLMFFIGFKSAVLNLEYLDSNRKKTSYTFAKRLKLAINSLISYTDVPHKTFIVFGTLIVLIVGLYSVSLVAQYILLGRMLTSGLTLILLVLCLSFGLTISSLGIIGIYIFRIYQEVLNRPRYIVRSEINSFSE